MKIKNNLILIIVFITNIALSMPVNAQEHLSLVELEKLGQPLNPKVLNNLELKSIRKLHINEDISTYVEESSMSEMLPRIVKGAGSEGKLIFTKTHDISANGGVEWWESSIGNLTNGSRLSIETTLRSFDDENSYYNRYLNTSEEDYNKYVVNKSGELVFIVRYSTTEKHFRKKSTCNRKASLLKVDSQKNVLYVVKSVSLPTSKECAPKLVETLSYEKQEAILNSYYDAAFNESLIKLIEVNQK